MNLGKQFKEGLITNNPVLVQVLGMCSVLAITTSFFNGLGAGQINRIRSVEHRHFQAHVICCRGTSCHPVLCR